jgi:hypothetical protein
MRTMGATAFSCFARKTAVVCDFASVIHNLIMDVRDSYRPGFHYMRGPGPKWRAKHQSWLRFDFGSVPTTREHQMLPVYARRCDAAHFSRAKERDSCSLAAPTELG